MSQTLTISAPLAMAAVPSLLAIGGVVVGIALHGWLTTGIEVARLNAANDDRTARWLWLRGYRRTPHAGPDITVMAAEQFDELAASIDVPDDAPALRALSDRSHADEQADHTDTDRAGMWRVLLGLGSDLVDRVHDWLPDLLAQWRERNDVGTGEQFGAEDPFAVDPDQPNDYDPVTGQRVQVVYPTPEPEPVRIVRVNRYRDPGMTGQFPYVKVAGAPRHAAPEPEMPAINPIPTQREAAE